MKIIRYSNDNEDPLLIKYLILDGIDKKELKYLKRFLNCYLNEQEPILSFYLPNNCSPATQRE